MVNYLHDWAPPALQESYDNCGLLCGSPDWEVKGVLTTLDCTEAVLEEALARGCNLIVAHHPLIFGGLTSLTGRNEVERTVIRALREEVAIIAIHTNLDNISGGVNSRIGEVLGLQNLRILMPKNGLVKLVTYGIPEDIERMRDRIFEAGGGHIGGYRECSFSHPGTGTFLPGDDTTPSIGTRGQRERVSELRLEVLVPEHAIGACVAAARAASSYEEIAYDVIPLGNQRQDVGSGMIGTLPEPMALTDFLRRVKDRFHCGVVRYTRAEDRPVKRVAFCGGSGSFLIKQAMRAGADVFMTSDVKYHQFFEPEGCMVIADIGHYENEQFTKSLLADKLREKFNSFAIHLSEVNTNPVNYLF